DRLVRCHVLTLARPATTLPAMARPAPRERDEETIPVPATVKFPVELMPPPGFDPPRLETWPRAEGGREGGEGRRLYMPPWGERLPGDPRLPGLAPMVDELFVQVSRAAG